MITKDGRDTPIERLTAENYIVPKGEERAYHCVIEVVLYDSKTGKKLSKPRVQKFGRKAFEAGVLDSLTKQGYTVTILHDPTEWLKAHKAKAAEFAKAKAEAEAKAQKEKFDAAVQAAVEAKLNDAVADAVAKALAKAQEKPAEQAETEKQGETQGEGEKPAETKKTGRPKKETE